MISSLITFVVIGFVVAAVATVCWMWYMGLFKTITVDVREIPEMTILNMNYTGSMQCCAKGCVDMERRVKEILPDMPQLSQAGSAYYTTPSQVENQNDNRWSCFYILDENKELLEKAKALPESDDYMVKTIPKMKAMYATFPYRSNLSFMFGPMRVYPAITAFMNSNNLKPVGCFEIYHFGNKPIEYIMYLENEDVFEQLQKTNFVAANLL